MQMPRLAPRLSHFEEYWCLFLTGIEEKTSTDDSIHIRGCHGCGAVGWLQGGEANTQHHGVRPGYAERLCELVNARCEEQILSIGKVRVDGGGGILRWLRDVEVADGYRLPGGCATMPGDSHAAAAQRGYADTQVSRRINLEERLLANDRGLGDFGVRRLRPLTRWWMGNAEEDHVPIGAAPTSPFGISGKKLLLWPRVHQAIDQVIGHPSAACPAAVLVQHKIAAD